MSLFCHVNRSLLPYEQVSFDTFAYLRYAEVSNKDLFIGKRDLLILAYLRYAEVSNKGLFIGKRDLLILAYLRSASPASLWHRDARERSQALADMLASQHSII